MDIKIFQNNPTTVYFEKKDLTVLMDDPMVTTCATRALETMREGEIAEVVAQTSYFNEHDKEAVQKLGINPHKELHILIELKDFITIVDWYRDRKTLRRTLKRGYKRVPFYESTVTLRFIIEVNGIKKFDNMLDETEFNIYQVHQRERREIDKKKKQLENMKVEEAGTSPEQEEDRARLAKEIEEMEESQKQCLKFKHEPLKFKLYEYTLPSLISKVVKTMYKDEIARVDTNRVDKMTNNF